MFGLKSSHIEDRLDKIEQDINHNKEIRHEISLLRRDVNDLHSIIMLKDASLYIPKKRRIVFIGTGQIHENVIQSYIWLYKLIQKGEIISDIEFMFVAVSELEEKLLANYGYPCKRWKYQTSLAYYLLETKVVVLSSHQYSHWGNNLLSHCISGAIRVQLWHGLPAKNIGLSGIADNMEFHFFVRLLQDSVMTQHICIQNSSQDAMEEYSRALPYAHQHVTGDARTDILFNEEYRQEFLRNKPVEIITDWIKNNQNAIKVVFAPTYREVPNGNLELYDRLLDVLANVDSKKVAIAIKLHVGIVLTTKQFLALKDVANKYGHLLIDYYDEIYSTFADFDAMIADYSSIRVDFAITGKPVLLWRYDLKQYKAKRQTDVVALFDEIDRVSEILPDRFDADIIIEKISQDIYKETRKALISENLPYLIDGQAAKRTLNIVLDVINN